MALFTPLRWRRYTALEKYSAVTQLQFYSLCRYGVFNRRVRRMYTQMWTSSVHGDPSRAFALSQVSDESRSSADFGPEQRRLVRGESTDSAWSDIDGDPSMLRLPPHMQAAMAYVPPGYA